MTTAEAHKNSGMGKDLVVYLCILALAGIQFVIAYQDISASQMFVRMLIVAIVEAALALLFFMHLWENRGLLWFFVSSRFLFRWGWNMGGQAASGCRTAYRGRRNLGRHG